MTVHGKVVVWFGKKIAAVHSIFQKSIPENSSQDLGYRRNMMVRPWLDSLIENKSKWQAKHDAGK